MARAELYVEGRDPVIREIIGRAFPGERISREVAVCSFSPPLYIASYWDGGSRQWFAAIDIATRKSVSMPPTVPFRDKSPIICELPPNVVIVEKFTFCGRVHGFRLHVLDENMTKMLPSGGGVETTDEQLAVLQAADALVSSYSGISNYRRHSLVSAGLTTIEGYEVAKAKLIELGLMSRNGAISVAGKNHLIEARRRGRKRFV